MISAPFRRENLLPSFLKKFFAENQRAENIDLADPQTKIRVAACAVLVEMANSDDEFTEAERDHIIDILKRRFDLDSDEALELMEIAERELSDSTDIFRFTNIIKQNFPVDDRMAILEEIWKLIYADGELSSHEDSLAHKLSFLLGLTHKQLIDAKLKVKRKAKSA